MIVPPELHVSASTTTTTPSPSPVTALRKNHEVEGRNRSALSYHLLKQHLSEFKFDRIESYTDVTQAEATTTTSSSSSFCTDEEETISPRRHSIVAPSCVRSKFLNKLGITPQTMPAEASSRRKDFAPKHSFSDPSYEMPLNDKSNGNEPETSELESLFTRGLSFFRQRSSLLSSSPEQSDSQNNTVDAREPTDENQSAVRSVRFAETVVVYPILKHTAFSNRIRETIWSSAQEMEMEVARNCIEFAAEEWDWTRVLEGQDMIVYHGELVHPVHFAMQEEQDE